MAPVASLGYSKESEGFLWRKKWKRNELGWPCLSHFLLPSTVSCLPLPARVVRRFLWGVGWAWGSLLLCCLPVALATIGQRWRVAFSDQRTVHGTRRSRCSLPVSHCNLLGSLGSLGQGLGIQQTAPPPRLSPSLVGAPPWGWSQVPA